VGRVKSVRAFLMSEKMRDTRRALCAALYVLWAAAAAQERTGAAEELLEVAARFEAVGRVGEARARVLEARELYPAHPAPVLALQRLDAARCPLPPPSAVLPATAEPEDGAECPWRFVDASSASSQGQCAAGDAACQPDAAAAGVLVLEVQLGSCGAILEGDRQRELREQRQGSVYDEHDPETPPSVYAVSFTQADPTSLREVTDLEEIDVVALEGCEKASRRNAQWHSIRLQLGAMSAPGLLTWVEGTDPFTVARLFAKFEDLDASAMYPSYSMVVARNNAVRGRAHNPHAPPWRIPVRLEQDYTMGGAVSVAHHYVDESAAEARDHYSFGFYRAPRAEIDRLVRLARARESNYYGDTDQFLYQLLADGGAGGRGWGLKGKDVVIVGSLEPWYEAVCLAEEAGSCTTLEYNKLAFEHPGLRTLTLDEYYAMEPGRRPTFDVALSISSFEHDGLGRYGDPLDPDGDLRAMDRMRAVVRPGGFLLLAVPVGADVIKWNAHRKYGRVRLPVLVHGWSLVAQVGLTAQLLDDANPDTHIQPVLVLRNDRGGSDQAGSGEGRSGRR